MQYVQLEKKAQARYTEHLPAATVCRSPETKNDWLGNYQSGLSWYDQEGGHEINIVEGTTSQCAGEGYDEFEWRTIWPFGHPLWDQSVDCIGQSDATGIGREILNASGLVRYSSSYNPPADSEVQSPHHEDFMPLGLHNFESKDTDWLRWEQSDVSDENYGWTPEEWPLDMGELSYAGQDFIGWPDIDIAAWQSVESFDSAET